MLDLDVLNANPSFLLREKLILVPKKSSRDN